MASRRAVWKYPLAATNVQTHMMPPGAELLCVQVQHDAACLWALVDPDAEAREPRTVRVWGTGDPGIEGGRYIGTFQMVGGAFVFHVFEETTP